MAITITGSKYGALTVASATSTTLSVTTSALLIADFGQTARIVGVWSSAGAFKGMAYVRQCLSSTTLQIENPVFDPATGTEVSVVAGDTILVSKKWSEVATGILVVDREMVTFDAASNVNNYLIWGTSGASTSLCFYDEGMTCRFLNPYTGNTYACNEFAGGLFVQGHVLNYASNSIVGGCNWSMAHTVSNSQFGPCFGYPSSTSAHVAFFSNRFRGATSAPLTSLTCITLGNKQGNFNSSGGTWIQKGCEFYDVLNTTNGYGALWQFNAARHISDNNLHNTYTVVAAQTGNTTYKGGVFKLRQYTNQAVGAVGVNAAGTWAIGAEVNNRLVINDVAQSVFWRSYQDPASSVVTVTNVLTSDYRAGKGDTFLTSAANTTLNFYFKDSYQNLQNGTACAAILNSTWALVDSATAATSAASVPLTIYYRTAVGYTTTVTNSAWTMRVRKYGYAELEYTVVPANYSLGAAGVATNVSFGGFQNQIQITSLPALAIADAVTGVTITDHGATPVSWNSKNWSITITCNTSVNPSLTAKLAWAYIKSQIAKTTLFAGRSGLLWHELIAENPLGAGYISQRGSSGGAGATLKGVRVVDQNGDAFLGFVSMTADDGTVYAIAEAYTLGVSNIVVGSRILIQRTDTLEVLVNQLAISSTYNYSYAYSSDMPIKIVIRKASSTPYYQEWSTVTTLSNSNNTQTANQILDF